VLSRLAGQRRAGQTLVGFAAEHGAEAVTIAQGKLAAKGLDALVVNDISRSDIGFDVSENEVTIVTAGGERLVPRTSKSSVAAAVLDEVGRLCAAGERAAKSREGANGAAGATAGRATRA